MRSENIRIIDHRGEWCTSSNQAENTVLQNSKVSFLRSFQKGRGVEFDVRDYNGDLVISHDVPKDKGLTLDMFFQLYVSFKSKAGILAINIKADGLQEQIKKALELYDIGNYFLFDMSVPDTIKYATQNLNFCIRESEHERDPRNFSPYLYEKAIGVWIDQFFLCPERGSWVTTEIIKHHLDHSKKVVIVSPELHPWGREAVYKNIWRQYKNIFEYLLREKYHLDDIYLCTDLPDEAIAFFKVEGSTYKI